MSDLPFSIEQYKSQAHRLATHLRDKHQVELKHGHALDAISSLHGFKDWNVLSAAARNEPNNSLATCEVTSPRRGLYRGVIGTGGRHMLQFEPLSGPVQVIPPRPDLLKLLPGYEIRWGYRGTGPQLLARSWLAFHRNNNEHPTNQELNDLLDLLMDRLDETRGFVVTCKQFEMVLKSHLLMVRNPEQLNSSTPDAEKRFWFPGADGLQDE